MPQVAAHRQLALDATELGAELEGIVGRHVEEVAGSKQQPAALGNGSRATLGKTCQVSVCALGRRTCS
jgi:hypothetical protein